MMKVNNKEANTTIWSVNVCLCVTKSSETNKNTAKRRSDGFRNFFKQHTKNQLLTKRCCLTNNKN